MATDTNLLKKLYAELTDFSYIDLLTRNEKQQYADFSNFLADDIRHSIEDGHSFDLSEFPSIVKTQPTNGEPPSHEYLSLLISLLELRSERAFSGISPQFIEKYEEVETVKNHLVGDVMNLSPAAPAVEQGPLLSEAWQDFVKFKLDGQRPWTERILQENTRMFERLLLIFGDVDVNAITKPMIRSALNTIACLPLAYKKPYNSMTVAECVTLAQNEEVPEEDLISSTTVKQHLKLMQSFFSMYLTKELDIYQKSPTEGIKYEASKNRYGIYNKAEVNKLLAASKGEETPWKRWCVPLLAYLGIRSGEFSKIEKDHVITDPETQITYLWIPEAKTDAGVRRVPIHKALIDMGFLDFVNAAPSGLLFLYNTRRSVNKPLDSKLIGVFVRDMVKALKISEINEQGQIRLVHSFRHTFITNARERGQNKDLVQVVVGHEGVKSITDNYTHTMAYSLQVLSDVVNAVGY